FFGQNLDFPAEEERLAAAKKAAKGSPFRAPTLLGLISRAKQNLERPSAVDDAELSAAFERYEANLAALAALDFDDLVLCSVELLENNPGLAKDHRRACQCLLIDEYQDINLAQYHLIRLLTSVRKPNLTVIGDPDQAIYGFRGADAAYFQRFIKDFPKAKTVSLTQNYRSTGTILKVSAQVIANNPGDGRPELVAGRQGPAKVTTAVLPTPRAEAEFVAAGIERLLGGTSHYALNSGRADPTGNSNLSLGDVAVLYRLHTQAEPLAQALAQAGLPVQQAKIAPLHETDDLDFSAEKINLLTMHAAKGLEFEAVFIVGLEQELLPYRPPGKPPAHQVEEERRLFYVALTRAKRFLYLTRSRNRTLFGRGYKPLPSPFLDEIEKKLKAVEKLPDRAHKPRQLKLFEI
ncbi:MAG: ATP-dependent helicase, partial [Thermodesulfobacteriota bacterium]|nr:ATP-dependent helicase [Thermodesulfobacteriota bacterium]